MLNIRILVAVFCIFTSGSLRASDDLLLSASCDKKEVPAGRTILVTITATWEGTDGAKYLISDAAFPALRNLELVRMESSGVTVPSAKGMRFERKLTYTFQAKEPGEAETGRIEVKYYRPEFKGEKVASADEKKEPTKPLMQILPSITIKVTSRTTPAIVPITILTCAGGVIIYFAYRILRSEEKSS